MGPLLSAQGKSTYYVPNKDELLNVTYGEDSKQYEALYDYIKATIGAKKADKACLGILEICQGQPTIKELYEHLKVSGIQLADKDQSGMFLDLVLDLANNVRHCVNVD